MKATSERIYLQCVDCKKVRSYIDCMFVDDAIDFTTTVTRNLQCN